MIFRCLTITQAITGNSEPAQDIDSLSESLENDSPAIVMTIKTILTAEQSADLVKALRDVVTSMLNEQVIMD